VTILDRDVIQQGLRSMTKEQRQAITTVAAQHADLISSAAPRLRSNPFIDEWRDSQIDMLVEQHRDLPCPALQADGSCGVYPFRPLTCRSMGIPAEEHGVVQGACEVQTFVPLVRLPQALREQEDALAKREAEELTLARRRTQAGGEELLLPYAFRPPS
jgi:Fe-S-cluster containining protein